MKTSNIKSIALCAMFAALTAVCSQISIHLPGGVPINLALLPVFAAGLLLPPIQAVSSIVVFVLLGAVGIPVFANGHGGIGVLVGPTGGFIIGYVVTAVIASFGVKFLGRKHMPETLVVALTGTYLPGIIWYMHYMNTPEKISTAGNATTWGAAFMACVAPFLIGDVVKILLASELARRLYPMLNGQARKNNAVQ
jgi:biotin transport system substrate-specific component